MLTNNRKTRLSLLARGYAALCATIAAAACVLLALEEPANAASQPSYVANGGLAAASNISSITPSLPPSPKTGDLLILQVGIDDTVTPSISASSAWTSLGTNSYGGYTAAIYWAVYTANLSAPTVSWPSRTDAMAVISQFAGVATSPIGAVGAVTYNNWGAHTSAALTTS